MSHVIQRMQPRGVSLPLGCLHLGCLHHARCRLSRPLDRSANLQQSHVSERICIQKVRIVKLSVLSSSAVPYMCLKAHRISPAAYDFAHASRYQRC